MNCNRCSTPNAEEARFCKNCGVNLTYTPPQTVAVESNSTKYLLILLTWFLAENILFLVLNKVVTSNMNTFDVSKIYSLAGWVTGLITIGLAVALAIAVKNKTIRLFFIAYAIVQVFSLLLYRVFN